MFFGFVDIGRIIFAEENFKGVGQVEYADMPVDLCLKLVEMIDNFCGRPAVQTIPQRIKGQLFAFMCQGGIVDPRGPRNWSMSLPLKSRLSNPFRVNSSLVRPIFLRFT